MMFVYNTVPMINTAMLPTPTKPKGKGKNVVERKGSVRCNGLKGGLDNLASGGEGVVRGGGLQRKVNRRPSGARPVQLKVGNTRSIRP